MLIVGKEMKKFKPEMGKVIELPRGGYLVDTSAGYIQVGSPPETIKDTMFYENGVPGIFCLPKNFFNRQKGISVAEVEFPVYYNFFFRERKIIIVCLKEHVKLFKEVIRESLLGPRVFNINNDYAKHTKLTIPNLKAEIKYFASFKLDDVVEFKPLDKKREVEICDCVIRLLENDDYEIIDEKISKKPILIPGDIKYNVAFDLGNILAEPFKPPAMGVTCLGPSHGFDPENNTSGFILWINHRGIMIDPPVNTTEWLQRSNVNPKLVDSVILTHTHADHDAGTFQEILLEEKITIYSTQTIMDSWLRKYSTLTRIDSKELIKLFDFYPVLIGNKVNINGAWFDFRYMLHSIPTIGFRLFYRNKSFVYTSDHLHLPEKFKELKSEGVLSEGRYKELMDFPWDSDVIYHESGLPPIHTPVNFLNSLPKNIQKKIVVYHIAKKDFPKRTNLTLAKFGIASTHTLEVEKGAFHEAYRVIDILSRVDIFKDFTLSDIKDLLAVVRKTRIKRGTQIIKKGEYGDEFYIILSGSIRVGRRTKKEANGVKRFGNYQYFGEVSIILNKPRTANVFAETDIEALVISSSSFLNLIRGTSVERKLKKIALNRDEESWAALSSTRLFSTLTSSQKTDLELLLHREYINSNKTLIRFGEKVKSLYIFHSGRVEVMNKKGKTGKAKMGDFIGNYKEFQLGLSSSIECKAKKSSLLFRLESELFKEYIEANPGVYLRFFEALGK